MNILILKKFCFETAIPKIVNNVKIRLKTN